MFVKALLPLLGVLQWLLALPVALAISVREWLRRQRLADQFPGPLRLPFFGNMFDMGFRIPDIKFFIYLLEEVIPRYRTGQFWMGPLRFIFLSEPEDIQNYLQNNKNQKKPRILIKTAVPLIGDGLIVANGEKWKIHRKVLEMAFHADLLNTFMDTFNKKTDIFLNILNEHAHGQPIELTPLTRRLALDITLETVLGVPSNYQTNDDMSTFHDFEVLHEATGYRGIRPWLYPNVLYKISPLGRRVKASADSVRGLAIKIIRERRAILKKAQLSDNSEGNNDKQRYRLVDAMLYHKMKGAPLSEDDVIEEVQTGITAGYDTVNLLVQFVMYNLAKYPEVQEKVVQELRSVFDGQSSEITTGSLQQLIYLEKVVKEVLRVNPPVWGFFRYTGADTPLATSNLIVPAGAYVALGIKSLHMDPKSFPDPKKFDPERWSPENTERRHPYSFMPFTMGQRTCIGKRYSMMEGMTIIAKILMNYELQSDPTYEPTYTWGLSAELKESMRLKVLKRQTNS